MFFSRSIEIFYLFCQGIIVFQAFFLGMLFLITRRKDVLYYSLFLLLTALYFFINAPNTFFGLDDNTVFNSILYRQGNIPLIVVTNLFYILFLKIFFKEVYFSKTLNKFFNLIFFLTPVLVIFFFVLRYFGKDTQSIFYIVNFLVAAISFFIISHVFRHRIPNTSWVASGMVVNILGTALTIFMIILERQGIRNLVTVGYPLIFMRIGILADMFFYQVALLKKWHHQEKQLAVEKLQSQLTVEQLRNDISRELHDDIGSTLSGIQLYSNLAISQVFAGNVQETNRTLKGISKASIEAVNRLKDIVWLNSSENITVETLFEKLKDYTTLMAKPISIIVVYNFLSENNKQILPGNIAGHLFLICKEAVNNAVKYSDADTLVVDLKFEKDIFNLEVKDNGIGFDMEAVTKGNGLNNLQQRATELNSDIIITTAKHKGTSVKLISKITR